MTELTVLKMVPRPPVRQVVEVTLENYLEVGTWAKAHSITINKPLTTKNTYAKIKYEFLLQGSLQFELSDDLKDVERVYLYTEDNGRTYDLMNGKEFRKWMEKTDDS